MSPKILGYYRKEGDEWFGVGANSKLCQIKGEAWQEESLCCLFFFAGALCQITSKHWCGVMQTVNCEIALAGHALTTLCNLVKSCGGDQ